MCALRALRLPPRTARIAHYAGISDLQVRVTLAWRCFAYVDLRARYDSVLL